VVCDQATQRNADGEFGKSWVEFIGFLDEAEGVVEEGLEGLDLAALALGFAVASVVEADHYVALLSKCLGDMGAMICMVVKPIENMDHTNGLLSADVPIGCQLDTLLVSDSHINELLLGEMVPGLWVGANILGLLTGLLNSFLLLLGGHISVIQLNFGLGRFHR
jgi:hypothetical protein